MSVNEDEHTGIRLQSCASALVKLETIRCGRGKVASRASFPRGFDGAVHALLRCENSLFCRLLLGLDAHSHIFEQTRTATTGARRAAFRLLARACSKAACAEPMRYDTIYYSPNAVRQGEQNGCVTGWHHCARPVHDSFVIRTRTIL
jgi:hypothetical protein